MDKDKTASKNYLKDLRRERHLTQTDLAKIIGVQREVVSYWEKGRRSPTNEQYARLKEYFGCGKITVKTPKLDVYGDNYNKGFDIKRLGAILQTRRKERGVTTEELAEKLHVSRSTISQWETGRHSPPTDVLKEICIILSISVSELIGIIPYEDNSMAYELLLAYAKLNKEGKEEAYKRVEELSEIEKYKKGDKGAEEI